VSTILIADDNSNIQKMVALALKDQGIQIIAVGNGEAAVRKLQDLVPDLVLADVFMPVRSGYEVCEYVKQDSRLAHVPVVLLTGAFDPFDQHEAERVGANGVLKKPFVPPEPLVNLVKSLLPKPPQPPAPDPNRIEFVSNAVVSPLERQPVPATFAPMPPPPPPVARAEVPENMAIPPQQPLDVSEQRPSAPTPAFEEPEPEGELPELRPASLDQLLARQAAGEKEEPVSEKKKSGFGGLAAFPEWVEIDTPPPAPERNAWTPQQPASLEEEQYWPPRNTTQQRLEEEDAGLRPAFAEDDPAAQSADTSGVEWNAAPAGTDPNSGAEQTAPSPYDGSPVQMQAAEPRMETNATEVGSSSQASDATESLNGFVEAKETHDFAEHEPVQLISIERTPGSSVDVAAPMSMADWAACASEVGAIGAQPSSSCEAVGFAAQGAAEPPAPVVVTETSPSEAPETGEAPAELPADAFEQLLQRAARADVSPADQFDASGPPPASLGEFQQVIATEATMEARARDHAMDAPREEDPPTEQQTEGPIQDSQQDGNLPQAAQPVSPEPQTTTQDAQHAETSQRAELIAAIADRVAERLRPQVLEMISDEVLRPILEALVRRELDRE
jgi:CheY-like chemotaxis protein